MGKLGDFLVKISNPLSSGIGAIGGAIQAGINARTQKRNVDMTNEAARKMAEYEYSKNLEMWNKTNEYNLPSSQMARLKQAGLNPNLVYGSGGATTQAAQMPKYNAPTQSFSYTPAVDIPSMIGMFQDIQIKNAQIDNLKAQYEGRSLANTWEDKMQNDPNKIKYSMAMSDMDRKAYEAIMKQQDSELKAIDLGTVNKYQADYQREKRRSWGVKNDQIVANAARANAGANYNRIMTDWYSSKAITDILTRFGIKIPTFNQKARR